MQSSSTLSTEGSWCVGMTGVSGVVITSQGRLKEGHFLGTAVQGCRRVW